jgi:hypothetical protein
MAQAQDLREAIASVADRPGPVFSAYVSVNAAIPENQERAYLVRIRDAMNDLGVPEDLQWRVREYVEAETHPGARTLVLFAAEDGLFEDYRLHVDVPESFRWGDPNVAPLALVMDEYEPYGAVVLDAERFRYFVVSPLGGPDGGEEIKGNGFRELDLRPRQPYPRSHGSTDMDPAGRTQQAKAHRYYKEMGELTRDVTFREGVRRLILAGPKERTAEFREAASSFYRDRFGVELDPASEVIPVLGGKEAVGHVAMVCLEEGDICLSPEPGYPPYTSGPVFSGAMVQYLPLTEENSFQPNLDALANETWERANLLYLNYPNNPTGAIVTDELFPRAVELARQHDVIVVHDNAYSRSLSTAT